MQNNTTIKQARARMNAAHARLLRQIDQTGSFQAQTGTALSDARGLATAGATLRKWGAVEVASEHMEGARKVHSWKLTDFGRALLAGVR